MYKPMEIKCVQTQSDTERKRQSLCIIGFMLQCATTLLLGTDLNEEGKSRLHKERCSNQTQLVRRDSKLDSSELYFSTEAT